MNKLYTQKDAEKAVAEYTNKAVVYVRGENLEQQYFACNEYAKKHNLQIVGVTSDFGEIAEMVASGEIDMVIVQDFNRIARHAEEYRKRTYQLRGYGVAIVSATQGEF